MGFFESYFSWKMCFSFLLFNTLSKIPYNYIDSFIAFPCLERCTTKTIQFFFDRFFFQSLFTLFLLRAFFYFVFGGWFFRFGICVCDGRRCPDIVVVKCRLFFCIKMWLKWSIGCQFVECCNESKRFFTHLQERKENKKLNFLSGYKSNWKIAEKVFLNSI